MSTSCSHVVSHSSHYLWTATFTNIVRWNKHNRNEHKHVLFKTWYTPCMSCKPCLKTAICHLSDSECIHFGSGHFTGICIFSIPPPFRKLLLERISFFKIKSCLVIAIWSVILCTLCLAPTQTHSADLARHIFAVKVIHILGHNSLIIYF